MSCGAASWIDAAKIMSRISYMYITCRYMQTFLDQASICGSGSYWNALSSDKKGACFRESDLEHRNLESSAS